MNFDIKGLNTSERSWRKKNYSTAKVGYALVAWDDKVREDTLFTKGLPQRRLV